MKEFGPEVSAEPTTLTLVLGSRHLRVELPPEIGGIEGAIDSWGKCGDQHKLSGETADTEISGFGDWLLLQCGVEVINDPA